MTDDERQQADLLDEYWTLLWRRQTVAAPPNLDPGLARVARIVVQHVPPDADRGFVAGLRDRIEVSPRRALPWRAFAALGAALLLFIAVGTVAGLLPWARAPQPANAQTVVAKAITAVASLRLGGVSTFRLQEVTATWLAHSGIAGFADYPGAVRSVSTWWYVSPRRWRVSGHYLVPPRLIVLQGSELGGTSFWPVPGTVVSDGRDIWRYDRLRRFVQVERIAESDAITQFSQLEVISPFGQNTGNLQALLTRAKQCWQAKLTGSTTIAGRDTYVVNLGPNLCLRSSNSAHLASGRSVLWVDKQTFFVLQWQLYDPDDPAKLLTQTTVTAVQYSASIPGRLLRLTPPRGTVIADSRSQATVAVRPYQRALGRLAGQLPFPLLAPNDRPVGLTWTVPHLLTRNTVDLAFVTPRVAPGSRPEQTGVAIVERPATAAALTSPPRAIRVAADGAAGWYRVTRIGRQLSLVREGTSIDLTSRVLDRQALIAFASVFYPVAGGHAPVAIPGIPRLTALRHELSFPVFVPTRLPAGFRLRSTLEGDGQRNPPNSVELLYRGRRSSLRIFESFAGCCIDQDVRKWVGPVRLANGIPAFQIEFGGLYLWWEQSGTFISVSSPQLKLGQLRASAGSMSSRARPAG